MGANKNRQRGKRNEKALAARLGGDRKGIMGGEDISYGPWSIETKSRKRYSIRRYMDQAIANCPLDKTPILILHEHNQRRDNDLVVIRLSDWELFYGNLTP